MIPVCKPCWGIQEEQAALRVMRSGRLIQGPEVEAFEQAVANYVGIKHAIAVSSGTTALHTALLAMGVGPGDNVLVPAFTFVATANAVLMCGAMPILHEIRLDNFGINYFGNMPRHKLVITVHPFGFFHPLGADHPVLEDAACALGSFKGLWGRAATFSFHATKIITTGEGGMVVTNDDDLAERCRFLRDQKHGLGMAYNYRMTEIHGAIGQEQMKRLPWILTRRAEIAAHYDAEFKGRIRARIPPVGNYQSYVLLLDEGIDRAAVIATLAERGVGALLGTQFLGNMPHLHAPGLPNAFRAGISAMRIPCYPSMTDAETDQVIGTVKEVLG